jgi:hypothetical protein
VNESQGLFSDGWAGRRLRYMLPPGSGKLRICGYVPEIKQLEGQAVSILSDGHEVIRRELPFGEFDITIDRLPGLAPLPANIEIRAAKVFIPAKAGLSDDNRRLAYQLRHIGWV